MLNDNIQRIVAATVGALVLTTLSVGAAVGPARIAETTPVHAAAGVTQNPVQAYA